VGRVVGGGLSAGAETRQKFSNESAEVAGYYHRNSEIVHQMFLNFQEKLSPHPFLPPARSEGVYRASKESDLKADKNSFLCGSSVKFNLTLEPQRKERRNGF
jgi:hypothetical protein